MMADALLDVFRLSPGLLGFCGCDRVMCPCSGLHPGGKGAGECIALTSPGGCWAKAPMVVDAMLDDLGMPSGL